MPILSLKTGTKSRSLLVGNDAFAPAGTRGLFAGGIATSTGAGNNINVIQYIDIATTGNSTDFGDLSASRHTFAGFGSTTRSVFGGGKNSSGTNQNVIEYVTTATTGNAVDFGDLLTTNAQLGGSSNATRGVFFGGYDTADVNTIQYVTIASAGNAIDFGDLVRAEFTKTGCGSPTRAIQFGGAYNGGGNYSDTITYFTYATLGNATSFGTYSSGNRVTPSSASSDTRALSMGGYTDTGGATEVNIIDYVTIATTGNTTDFGDLTVARYEGYGVSTNTRAVAGGGLSFGGGTTLRNVMDYVTIASTGNATDFGDLLSNTYSLAGASNGHGGLV